MRKIYQLSPKIQQIENKVMKYKFMTAKSHTRWLVWLTGWNIETKRRCLCMQNFLLLSFYNLSRLHHLKMVIKMRHFDWIQNEFTYFNGWLWKECPSPKIQDWKWSHETEINDRWFSHHPVPCLVINVATIKWVVFGRLQIQMNEKGMSKLCLQRQFLRAQFLSLKYLSLLLHEC